MYNLEFLESSMGKGKIMDEWQSGRSAVQWQPCSIHLYQVDLGLPPSESTLLCILWTSPRPFLHT